MDDVTNLDIYFKSGNKITLRVTNYSLKISAYSSELTSFKWTNVDPAIEKNNVFLRHIDLAAIEAIVERDNDE